MRKILINEAGEAYLEADEARDNALKVYSEACKVLNKAYDQALAEAAHGIKENT